MSTSQTLDRGLTALTRIARGPEPPTIDGLAADLGVHRSIAYRIVRTLEEHRFVRRDDQGRCHPAEALAALASTGDDLLRAAAADLLPDLAAATGLTAFLVVREGDDAVTAESIEPSGPLVGITYRPGTRHPLDRGAPGLAILAGAAPVPGERSEVAEARRRGWAASTSEVVPGLTAVAAPIPGRAAAVAVVALAAAEIDLARTAAHVMATAGAVAARCRPTDDQGDR